MGTPHNNAEIGQIAKNVIMPGDPNRAKLIAEKYLENLQEILNFADVINNADVSNLDITIGTYENKNVFRKDEVKEFGNLDALLQNAPEKEQNMFKIPKVIN